MQHQQQIWQQYYQQALSRRHHPRTEFVVRSQASGYRVAIDCGCGTGSDIAYLAEQGYQVIGFDVNEDAVAIASRRFQTDPRVEIQQSSFETFDYPGAGVVLANDSLYFADGEQFAVTWQKIQCCLQVGGVFAGDFMGNKDSWAQGHHTPTHPMTRDQVQQLFDGFEILRFVERDETGMTALGRSKHWHTFSVVAIKR